MGYPTFGISFLCACVNLLDWALVRAVVSGRAVAAMALLLFLDNN